MRLKSLLALAATVLSLGLAAPQSAKDRLDLIGLALIPPKSLAGKVAVDGILFQLA